MDLPAPTQAERVALVLGMAIPAFGLAKARWQRAGIVVGWLAIGAGLGAAFWIATSSGSLCGEPLHAPALVVAVLVGMAGGIALGRRVVDRPREVLVAAVGAGPMAALVAMSARVALGLATTVDTCGL